MWRDNKRRDNPPEWCFEAALTAWNKMTRGRRDKIGACARHLKTRVPGSREFCKWLEQLVIECRKRRRAEKKNPGKYRVEKRGQWRIYWSDDKRIRLHEGKRQVKVKRAFGRYKGLKTERYWNVFVDGKLIGSRGRLKDAKELAEAKLSGGPTRKRRNPIVTKRKPKFIVQRVDGTSVWSYGEWEIQLKRTDDAPYEWESFVLRTKDAPGMPSGGYGYGGAASPTEQAALTDAKYWIDKKEKISGEPRALFAIEALQEFGLDYARTTSKLPTRTWLARQWKTFCGQGVGAGTLSPSERAGCDHFDALPIKERLAIMDDVIGHASRWYYEMTPNPKHKRKNRRAKNPRPTKNPDRAQAIMRSFMRL